MLTGNASAISVGRIENGEIKPITRQITNVAAGTRDSDAVNVAQLRNINLMVKADGGYNNGTSDVLLDKHYFKVAGEDLLSTELNDDNGDITVKVKAKTAKVTSNPDGTYKIDGDDGFVKASDLADKLNKDKEERDKLRNEMKNITYVNKDGDKLKKDDDGNFYKVKPDGTIDKTDGPQDPIAKFGTGDTIPLTTPKGVFSEIDKSGLGVLETAANDKAVNAEDLRKLGWVVNVNGDQYTEVVKQRNQVSFVDGELVHVKGSTVNDVRQISFSISPDEVSDAVKKEFDRKGHTPVKYVDKDGKPLVKNPNDGKFYYPKSDTDLTPDESKGEQTPKILVGDKDKDPVEMTNVAPGAKTIATDGPTKGLTDLGKDAKPTNVATIADLQNMGFVVTAKDNYNAQVKNAHTLNFVGDGLAEVTGASDKEVHTITVKVPEEKVTKLIEDDQKVRGDKPLTYVDKDGNPLLKVGDKFYPVKDGKADTTAEPKEPVGIKAEKELPLQNIARGVGDIKEEGPTKGLADLNNAKDGNVMTVADAKNLGFVIKGKTAEDKDITSQIRNADIVEFAGEDLAKVITSAEKGTTKITVKVNKEDITKAVNAENAKNGNNPLQYVDEDGNPLVKGDDGKYYPKKDDGTPDKDKGAKEPVGVKLEGRDKEHNPLPMANVGRGTGDITDKGPTKGLADLGKGDRDGNVVTVADLKKLGFVVAAGDKYTAQVGHAQTLKFVGDGLAEVSGETKDEVRTITVKVDEKKVNDLINADKDAKGEAPVTYVGKDGQPLTKIGDKYYPAKEPLAKGKDGKIYKASDLNPDGTPKNGDVKPVEALKEGPAAIKVGEDKALPMQNVGRGTGDITKAGPTKGLADLSNAPDTNVMTVADAKKLGFVVAAGDKYTAQVGHAQTLKFVGDGIAEVTGETKDDVRTITVKVDEKKVTEAVKKARENDGEAPLKYIGEDGKPLTKIDGKYYPAEAKPMKGQDGKMYKASDLNPDGTLKNADAKPIDGVVAPSGVKVDSEKPLSLSNVGRGTKDIEAPKDTNAPEAEKAKAGLADLGTDAKADNVATVGDLQKMGFVIAGKDKDGKDVAGQVKNADTVEFEGTGLAKVTTETKDGKHKITVNVDEKEISKAVKEQNQDNALFTFEDKDKNPLRKLDDKFYKVQPNEAIRKVGDQVYKVADLNRDGTPKDGAKALTPISDKEPVHIVAPTGNNGQAAPLTNIGSNLKEIKPDDKTATAPTAEELKKIGNNAATINDVMNTGWNLKVNGKDTKVVKPFDTVEFVNGANTTVVADKDGKLQVNVAGLPMAYTDKDGAPLAKVGDKYYAMKADGTPDMAKEATPTGVGLMNPKAEKGKTGEPVALKNVAPGRLASDSTDAVNGSQLFRTEQKVARLGGQINEVGAGAAALAALHPLDFDPDEKLDFSVGYGNYKGEHAAAVGAHYRPNEDTMVSVGGSFGGGDNMVNAGVSFRFGQKNHVSNTRIEMAKEMIAMKEHILKLEAIISRLEGTHTSEDRSMDLFPDVPANHWAYEYVKGLQEKGIIEGYPSGNFDGDRHMTRYEMAAMIYRALMKGAQIEDRLLTEFAPELGRIRIDVISQDKNGKPTIERVRVNK